MAHDLVSLATAMGQLVIDPALGNLHTLMFHGRHAPITPLARAPWADDPVETLPEDLPLVEQRLSGDFFCAPFGVSDVNPAPLHGWSANSPWEVAPARQTPHGPAIEMQLKRRIQGATITKTCVLGARAPVLYQTHRIAGGVDALTFAHHPMVAMAPGDAICTSPKRVALSPDTPLETGRSWLRYPATATDLTAFPGVDGPADLTRFPAPGSGHDDFVTLVEAQGRALGWTALVRADDIVIVLKDPRQLPVTMLWFSNGGRDDAPWSGRHRGVLGVADGCAAGTSGHRAAMGANPVTETGVATHRALRADITHVVHHATIAVPRPPGLTRITDVVVAGDRVVATGVDETGVDDVGAGGRGADEGAQLSVPFDPDFFGSG